MHRKIVGPLLVAIMMAIPCDSFVPSGRVAISPRTNSGSSTRDKAFMNKPMKRTGFIVHASDAGASEIEASDPEKKSLLGKVWTFTTSSFFYSLFSLM